jgi:hypothetical protein
MAGAVLFYFQVNLEVCVESWWVWGGTHGRGGDRRLRWPYLVASATHSTIPQGLSGLYSLMGPHVSAETGHRGTRYACLPRPPRSRAAHRGIEDPHDLVARRPSNEITANNPQVFP